MEYIDNKILKSRAFKKFTGFTLFLVSVAAASPYFFVLFLIQGLMYLTILASLGIMSMTGIPPTIALIFAFASVFISLPVLASVYLLTALSITSFALTSSLATAIIFIPLSISSYGNPSNYVIDSLALPFAINKMGNVGKYLSQCYINIFRATAKQNLLHYNLIKAIKQKDEKLVSFLIDNDANPNTEHVFEYSTLLPLQLAVANGCGTDILDKLINAGADINASAYGNMHNTPIRIAVRSGEQDTILHLIKRDCDLSQGALHDAVDSNQNQIVKMLLGIDIPIGERSPNFTTRPTADINSVDKSGANAILHVQTPAMAKLLIEEGIDVNSCVTSKSEHFICKKSKGYLKLHEGVNAAFWVESANTLEVLYTHGLNIDAVTTIGKNALFSCNDENIPKLEFLLGRMDIDAIEQENRNQLIVSFIRNGDYRCAAKVIEQGIQHSAGFDFSFSRVSFIRPESHVLKILENKNCRGDYKAKYQSMKDVYTSLVKSCMTVDASGVFEVVIPKSTLDKLNPQYRNFLKEMIDAASKMMNEPASSKTLRFSESDSNPDSGAESDSNLSHDPYVSDSSQRRSLLP